MRTLWTGCLALLLCGAAKADTLWDYSGVAMNGQSVSYGSMPNCSCALTGSVVLNDAFQPVSWNFSADGYTLTQANSTLLLDVFVDGSTDPFLRWLVSVNGAGVSFNTEHYADPTDYQDDLLVGGSLVGFEQGQSGSWLDGPVSSAEPANWILLLLGLVVLYTSSYIIGRRRRA